MLNMKKVLKSKVIVIIGRFQVKKLKDNEFPQCIVFIDTRRRLSFAFINKGKGYLTEHKFQMNF